MKKFLPTAGLEHTISFLLDKKNIKDNPVFE